MEHFAHQLDCGVERDLNDYPGQAVLMDCDGNILFTFEGTWTDAQIFDALKFANETYAYGVEAGKAQKISEIKRALGLPMV